jgi:uncharacterized protein involved in exopolysaccharide biosynthesis
MEDSRRWAEGTPLLERDRVNPLSPFTLINIALRDRWVLVVFCVSAVAVVLALQLIRPREYVSTASFLPESGFESEMNRFSGLAAQIGVQVASGKPAASPEFYAHLIRSREILSRLARESYKTAEGNHLVPLIELYKIEAKTPEEAISTAVSRLSRQITVRPNLPTSMVQLSVTTPWPSLSTDIAGKLLELVNEFNLRQRQSRAAAEREFIENRLKEAETELAGAERRLQKFLEENRQYDRSPALTFQADRLQGEVLLRQGVVTTLIQSFDQARIEQLRNTPVITVVENPEHPAPKVPRNTVRRVFTAAFVGLLLGLGFITGRESYRNVRRSDEERYNRFLSLRRAAVQELTRPFAALRRG